jgi:hypothetical protein
MHTRLPSQSAKAFFARRLIPVLAAGVLGTACMSAPVSERVRFYSAESPTTGPAGVPGSGGTGAAGSFGSGGTFGGTTAEGAQNPGNESVPTQRRALVDGGTPR